MKRRPGLVLCCFALMLAVAAPVYLRSSDLRLNGSDSVPLGLYQAKTGVNSPYAGICLLPEILRPALNAGLELGHGECPDGHQPILKPIYRATGAAPVSLDAEGFMIAGHRIRNTAPKAISKEGKPLNHYPFGIYKDGLWAISGHSPDSYDSRYFGPVQPGEVRFYAKPLLVF